MAYGIDEIIEQKKNAYRGNPAALQQRSKVSKQLTDVLALEELTREVDARSRQMQMQIQQQPGTIAEQLQQKAIGQKQSEVLQGVSGVLANNQARRQQNMQRMASQGVAAQPRRNMQNMAQGGIVGFQEGKKVNSNYTGSRSKQREEILRDLKAGKISQERADELIKALPLPTVFSGIEQIARAAAPEGSRLRDAYERAEEFLLGTDEMQSPAQSVLRGADTAARFLTKGVDDILSIPGKMGQTDPGAFLFTPRPTTPEEPEEATTTEEPTTTTEQNQEQEQEQEQSEPEKDPLEAGIAGLQKIAVPKRGELDAGTRALDAQRRALASNLAAVDPKAERDEAAQYAERVLDRSGKADEFAELQRQLADFQAKQMDPDKLRNERLQSFLLGGTGTTFAQTLRNAGRASMQAGRQQQISEKQNIIDTLNLKQKAIEVDTDLGKAVLGSANYALQQASADRREGSEALGRIVGEEKTRLENEVKNKLDANIANLRADTEKLKLMSQAADRKELRASRDVNAITKQINDINSKLLDMYDNQMEKDIGFQTALMTHAANIQKGASAEELARSQAAVDAARERLYAEIQVAARATGVITARADLEARLNELIGTRSTASGGVGSADVASVTKKPNT